MKPLSFAHCSEVWKLIIFSKLIHSEKVTKFDEIFTVVLKLLSNGKNTMEISSNFVTLSENLNFTW